MLGSSSVICLEFNELTPGLLDEFIKQGHLPHFARLKQQSATYTTDANATGEWLNPWVQWVTVHSGLEASEHEVYRLSNAYKLNLPAIWKVISDAGRRVWICGSMNPWSSDNLDGHVLPDPWSHRVAPYPQGEFDHYEKFVRKNVENYAARKTRVTLKERFRFVQYMLDHGLHLSTIGKVIKQLFLERIGRHRWKRASVLDALQFDLFEHYYKEQRPDFSTFFTNSAAHYQHKYWRNMEPEKFLIRPTSSEQRSYKDAILYGYQQLDELVGRTMRMAPQATIMLVSGLSQQPYLDKDHEGGLRYYRLHNKDALTKILGVSGEFSYEPIMADEFFLRFVNQIDAEACSKRLSSLLLPDGTPAFQTEVEGSEVIGQCRCRELLPEGALLRDSLTGEEMRFSNVFYWVDSVKSGTHAPEGVLWIRHPDGEFKESTTAVRLTQIAPTILDCLDVAVPEFMGEFSLLEKEGGFTEETRIGEPQLV